MGEKNFLWYCPNCNNYNESSGVCSYIHENVLQYPDKFIKYCDGKYLSLIKGKAIESFNESLPEDADTDEDKLIMISVFYSNNYALFQIAKTLLKNYGIKFWSNGEFASYKFTGAAYKPEIKVLEKDEEAAKKILSELTPDQYIPSNEVDRKITSFIGHWGIWIIALSFIMMIIILSILYKFK